MRHIYLDIETATQPDVLLGRLHQHIGEHGPVMDVMEWLDEHAADEALNPIGGCVTAWAFCTDETEPMAHVAQLNDWAWGMPGLPVVGTAFERALLLRLDDLLDIYPEAQIVAHNGDLFDFPFLRMRALVHRLPRIARRLYKDKPWELGTIDTASTDWVPRPRFGGKGWKYSMDALADAFNIERAETAPGKDMPRLWYRGDYDAVRAHVADDVATLRAVFLRLASGRAA